MTWKNLHFRPPILKKEDGRTSGWVLFRLQGCIPVIGRIVLTPKEPNVFALVRGRTVFFIKEPEIYEWMEVPE